MTNGRSQANQRLIRLENIRQLVNFPGHQFIKMKKTDSRRRAQLIITLGMKAIFISNLQYKLSWVWKLFIQILFSAAILFATIDGILIFCGLYGLIYLIIDFSSQILDFNSISLSILIILLGTSFIFILVYIAAIFFTFFGLRKKNARNLTPFLVVQVKILKIQAKIWKIL